MDKLLDSRLLTSLLFIALVAWAMLDVSPVWNTPHFTLEYLNFF
jgi:hypothetical protein